MYVIIGTYREGDNIKALKILDLDTGKMGMYNTNNVLNAVYTKGITVMGTGIRIIDDKRYVVLGTSNNTFNVRKLDRVDGYGNPLNDKGVWVVIETSGFGNMATFTLVNSRGEKRVAHIDDFNCLLDAGRIVGAKRKRYGFTFHKHCEIKGVSLN